MIETYTRRIWDVLKPILRLPDNLPLPMFETGGSWHSVVFHNLPAAKHDCYALPHVQESLREGGFNHVVKAISILCDDQELERRVKNKIPISMRVSVLTEAAAQQLVDRGGHIFHLEATAIYPYTSAEFPLRSRPVTVLQIQAVERMMRDIRGSSERFGGCPVLFSDFKSHYAIDGYRGDIINSCLTAATFWSKVHQLHLTQNMRLLTANVSTEFFLKNFFDELAQSAQLSKKDLEAKATNYIQIARPHFGSKSAYVPKFYFLDPLGTA
ncbi:hypothetical protein DFH07DRAFT_784558 [Mycena maculata]|uniref:ATP-dependent DNA helicase n=1 Tax=Mycena maculata TaxID=230809 RepID=A0AAD7H6V8_9AGAR|nr:hypothetical protein DFH07DRAFT_785917 [Mycena maculata]KAJ7719790.1 hypothetical protein DFH07DRAFT_784558 [Mycena maculata]